MLQLIPLGLFQDQLAPFPYSIDASQIGSWVNIGVGSSRKWNVGQAVVSRSVITVDATHLGLFERDVV